MHFEAKNNCLHKFEMCVFLNESLSVQCDERVAQVNVEHEVAVLSTERCASTRVFILVNKFYSRMLCCVFFESKREHCTPAPLNHFLPSRESFFLILACAPLPLCVSL